MKNLTTLKSVVLLIGATAALTACHKDKDNVPTPSRTDLLTAKSWHLTSLQTAVTFKGNTVVQNLTDSVSTPCMKDNFYKFNADKTLVLDEGLTKCNAAYPQITSLTWDFDQDQTHLSSARPEVNGAIVELSATTLHLRATDTASNPYTAEPITLVTDITYTAF